VARRGRLFPVVAYRVHSCHEHPSVGRPPLENSQMQQLTVITAVGTDRAGVVHDLTRAVLECGGNIVESRMSALGSEFAMLLLVSGNWHTLARLESELKKIGETSDLTVTLKRTEARTRRENMLPYAVDVVCLDQPGIVFNLATFFSNREIDIAEMNTRSYAAAHTGAPMFSVQMTINVPGDIQIAALRDEFMDFCDQLNLDAIMEPVKG
jgi:glycine cleavage system transcriptional repressor